jgi:glycosyltransferase involved in cell wall biosynthesis
MGGENPKDAAHIQQKYIAEGLRARGHSLMWIAPHDLDRVVYAGSSGGPILAPQTWTASGWFDLLARVIWKIQQLFRFPYLNFFSNLRRYDACLQIFPGHDVVFERNGLYNSGVAMACKNLNLPYVMFFDADQMAEMEFMGKPLKGLLRWRAANLLRYNLHVANRVICVSEAAKIHLMKNWDVPSEKLVVFPNAVDAERFKPEPELGAQTRASLQLTHHPLLVFVGSFYRWHDVVTLLKAFAVVLKTHSDARLVLVGDGAERETMMKLSVDLGVEHAAQFTGLVNHTEVSRYVNAADIAVAPVPNMEQEMWLSPMKLFEYMASGKAIVASAMGQIRDVIKDGENGMLVPAGDEMVLANAINRLIEDAPLRTRLGQQAREDAIRYHSWGQYITSLENVFTDIARSLNNGGD